ncbi:hypothetical protein JL100_029220 [Skermanella mucosa]|uniref:hypothetical protein n=1 Tax=Skermanella mucosa TaxID=1789672 RepID=UPI00192C7D62|nr:hypothetical protein [Skermanella mucosa]UEM21095.1 hypothetical protein JL100_029220 [Skermanella mucosa]
MGELQRFVADLLEETGAVVEPVEPEGLDVLAPPEAGCSASMAGTPGWSRRRRCRR